MFLSRILQYFKEYSLAFRRTSKYTTWHCIELKILIVRTMQQQQVQTVLVRRQDPRTNTTERPSFLKIQALAVHLLDLSRTVKQPEVTSLSLTPIKHIRSDTDHANLYSLKLDYTCKTFSRPSLRQRA